MADHKSMLLVVADDLGLMLGCYGLNAIKTPHLDRLALQDKAAETDRPFHLTVGFRDPRRDETHGGFGNDSADTHGPDGDVRHIPLRTELFGYFKAICRLDAGMGLLLEELDEHGLGESTLVVFISGNGAPFVNSKTTHYDAGVRLPLIFRKPGNTAAQRGVVNPDMVSWIDILPTCLDWAVGSKAQTFSTPYTSQVLKRVGSSFLSILGSSKVLSEDKWQPHYKCHRNISWKLDFPFATNLYVSLSWDDLRNSLPAAKSEGAITDTPKLMIGRRRLESYVYRGPEELFDLEADPEEVNNLAKDSAYKPVLCRMRAQLENWQYQTDDVWLFRDGPGNAAGAHWVPISEKVPNVGTTEFA
ncbi:n-sulfoglucosamine sulfohydrolase [Ophiostoma piceae UAMH 11346]|uniref:N-sulfoglucosamine sulfohydrolase n=1 Tax=Ophiostoma piceae (strain UAMH 11346) TaxID=1262450 RepID=S3BTR9_OPHP1|nr:n-sulfoglucosamine sulfohydrolase [Ophiostoma piceae UAMH 11346]